MSEYEEQIDNDEVVEAPEFPDKLKLELKTPLETFFMWAGIISGFVLFAGFIDYIEDGLNSTAKLMLALGGLLLALFGSLYFHTDNYYVVDRIGERILYHFKFFFYRRVSTVCRFSEIALITTGGKRKKSKYSVWWEYAVFFLTTNGDLIRVTDFAKDAFFDQKRFAQKLCDITGAKFIDAPKERIVRETDLNSVRHDEHTLIDTFVEIGTTFVVTGAVIAIFVTLIIVGQPLLKLLESAGK